MKPSSKTNPVDKVLSANSPTSVPKRDVQVKDTMPKGWNKLVIGIGNVVNKAAEKYPIINTVLNNPIKSGAVIGVAAIPLIVGGVYATGGAITCGVVCPAATVAGGSIAGTAARFGNTIKDTATKIGNSANSLVQKGASTVTKVGSSPGGRVLEVKLPTD